MSAAALILASRSKARAALLRGAGCVFRQVVSGVPEPPPPRGTPLVAHVRALARLKAEAVACRFPDAWVIGSDTALVMDGHVIGKPRDLRDAAAMLRRLCGRTHRICSAACVIAPLDRDGRRLARTVSQTAQVLLRDWPAERIRHHVRSTRPLRWAGAYAVQDPVSCAIVARIRGDLATVVGLPLDKVLALLPRACRRTRPAGP